MNVDQGVMMQQMQEEGTLRRKNYRPIQPEGELQFNIQEVDYGEETESALPQAPSAPMTAAPTSAPAPGYAPLYSNDEPIFPGGPYESQVLSWKKQFGRIYLTEIGEDAFVFHFLTRVEYKQIMALPNMDPLQREELISEVAVLWPTGYTYEAMAPDKAGLPAMISEQILDKSGFTRNISVRAL